MSYSSPTWPISPAKLRQAMTVQNESILKLSCRSKDELGYLLNLAAPAALSNGGWLTHLALCADVAEIHHPILQKFSEWKWLCEARVSGIPQVNHMHLGPRQEKLQFSGLRRLARMATWTPLLKLPKSITQNKILAVSHNSLMVDCLKSEGIFAKYTHGDQLLREFQSKIKTDDDLIDAAVKDFLAAYTNIPGLSLERRMSLSAILEPRIKIVMTKAQQALFAAKSWGNAPEILLSGTGGAFSARALGLEVLRRGGEAWRYDHGGTRPLITEIAGLLMVEAAASSRFITFTPEMAKFADTSPARNIVPHCQMVGGAGDPHFRGSLDILPQAKTLKPRVLYVPGIVIDQRELYPPLPTSSIYLDWQRKVADALSRMPILPAVKPHPEGLFRGKKYPLEDIIKVKSGLFEKTMKEFDLFIFDYPISTTFWVALCSHAPIILLDLGLAQYRPEISGMLHSRCKVISCEWDGQNRPLLDREKLGDVVISALQMKDINPQPFRRLLIGSDQ